MKNWLKCLFLVSLGSVSACGTETTEVPLRSLQASGAVSYVCVDGTGRPLDMRECPNRGAPSGTRNRLLGLVTQTLTGEVAVIDTTRGRVVDVTPSVPGYSALPVGARPTDIASTEDGQASFVTVADPRRPGVYGLPTSCVERGPDISQWPACALPSAPSELTVVYDRPSVAGTVRASCARAALAPGPQPSSTRAECPADLTVGATERGQPKLVISMPEQGALAVIDAQSLLNRDPGSFAPCSFEAWLPLDTSRPGGQILQSLPEDLVKPGEPSQVSYDFPATAFTSRPSAMALAEDMLFVSDEGAPLIHRIDVSDVCNLREMTPLLPTSLRDRQRNVLTGRLAVSPLTSEFRRFLYAIDVGDHPTSSVMVFDVSRMSKELTPIVRSGSPRIPGDEPDRIMFAAPAQDVIFAAHDVPITDSETGVGVYGTRCNPDPAIPPDALQARYRPSANLRAGAGPLPLRGTFGFVLLANGQLAVLDVEDADAPCRRPALTEPSGVENFQGCRNDEGLPPLLTLDTTSNSPFTVTNEISCRMVEPHRPRSAQVMVSRSDIGARAPALTQFPVLTRFGTRFSAGQSEQALARPRLLPADFVSGTRVTPAQVFVNTTLFVHDQLAANVLEVDPRFAERNALGLPLNEPRSYPPSEDVNLTFEGLISGLSATGFRSDISGQEWVLADDSGLFCDRGVQSKKLVEEIGRERFGLAGGELEAFSEKHADYLQITSDFPASDDPYWTNPNGACDLLECRSYFGPAEVQDLEVTRDFRIVTAGQDRLGVEPRDASLGSSSGLAACCFPGLISYGLRGGSQWILAGSRTGLRHRVEADAQGECVLSQDPRKALLEARAFEVSSSTCAPGQNEADCPVGPRTVSDTVCVYDHNQGPLPVTGPISRCVFDGLTARFVVYRGNEPSQRDMVFSWRTVGGFSPLLLNFGGFEATVGRILPVRVEGVAATGQLSVVDGSTLGLTLIDLLAPQSQVVSYN